MYCIYIVHSRCALISPSQCWSELMKFRLWNKIGDRNSNSKSWEEWSMTWEGINLKSINVWCTHNFKWSACTKLRKRAVLHLSVKGIHYAPFHDFSIEFYNCSDTFVFFVVVILLMYFTKINFENEITISEIRNKLTQSTWFGMLNSKVSAGLCLQYIYMQEISF